MSTKDRIEGLLKDSFANYVVQTALDFANPQQKEKLVEFIIPVLPLIRNSPHGKRIQQKLQNENLAPAVSVYLSGLGMHPLGEMLC